MFENLAQLKTPRARRVFAFSATTLLILELVLLGLLEHFSDSIPDPYFSVIKEVLVHLTGASITAMFLVGLLVYLLPAEEKLKSVEIFSPSQTKALHDSALLTSDFWYHHGHIGRWVRTTAMPALARISVENGIITTIKLILLNPRNSKLCELYAEYRNQISFKENTLKTIEDVQAELLATIITGQKFDQGANGLGVHIFLEDQLSLVREDISSTAVFRTQVNPRCPSIVYRKLDHDTSEFYNAAKTNFDFAARCCTRLIPEAKFPDGQLTIDKIKAYLAHVGLLVHEDHDFLKSVMTRVQSDYHPYT